MQHCFDLMLWTRFCYPVPLTQIRAVTLEVASKLLEVLVVQYPVLREAVRGVAKTVLERSVVECKTA